MVVWVFCFSFELTSCRCASRYCSWILCIYLILSIASTGVVLGALPDSVEDSCHER